MFQDSIVDIHPNVRNFLRNFFADHLVISQLVLQQFVARAGLIIVVVVPDIDVVVVDININDGN